MATFWAKIRYRNIVSELDFFKTQIQTIQVWYQGEKSSFDGLNFEEITPFRSLEDDYGTVYVPIHELPTSKHTLRLCRLEVSAKSQVQKI